MICRYQEYDIESFEAGRGLWHARIRRTDSSPLVINGYAFPALEVGFAWSDPDAAIADARHHIDRFKHRWDTPQKVAAA
ncbi:MAG TPA: hypothetical protein VKR55_10740 [Bradyrhizobium sp.]|uniref:hypothetical protein n=1 Tax=Bradyrhizobium sp. TaxID=376 RepID=UPI002CBF5AA9|nr:hypothetical protein [Bradyrhizobium sp.]HLZ02612.1 hypothetical protein [Bradyrhizobium sp.]